MQPSEVAARRCARSYLLLANGGVRVRWHCGAHKDFPGETAVDVEVIADHLADVAHHHRIHMPSHHPSRRGVTA